MSQARRVVAASITVGLSLCGLAPGAARESCTAARSGVQLGEVIGIEGDPSLPRGTLEQALARWSSCSGGGVLFPALSTTTPGPGAVHVRYVAGSSQDERCGYFAGREIVLFASAVDRTGRTAPCDAPAVNLAHELGHVLGLLDAPSDRRCRGFIMAADDPRRGAARGVQPAECQAADDHWRTPAEGAVLSSVWQRLEGANHTTRWVPTAEAPFEDVGALAAPSTATGIAPWDESARYRPLGLVFP